MLVAVQHDPALQLDEFPRLQFSGKFLLLRLHNKDLCLDGVRIIGDRKNHECLLISQITHVHRQNLTSDDSLRGCLIDRLNRNAVLIEISSVDQIRIIVHLQTVAKAESASSGSP